MDELKDLKVLFVEDEKLAREKLTKILGKIFRNVDSAENGKVALDKYNENIFTSPYDLIISDINMPIMNGLEFIEKIRKNNDETPIIFTTARNETDFLLNAIDLNVSHYMIKPIDLGSLITNVKKVCEKTLIKKSLENKKQEMENLIGTLDNFAAVCRFDLKGKITYANELFLNYSEYTNEELNDLNIKDLICNISNKISIQSFEESIKNGQKWTGTLKKITKNQKEYYVTNFTMPINDDFNNLKEFITIQYLVTNSELKKRHLQNKLYDTLQQFKEKEIKNKKELDELKKAYENSNNKQIVANKIKLLVHKINTLQNQISHTDEEFKKLRQSNENIVTRANTKVTSVMNDNSDLKKQIDYLKNQLKTSEERSHNAHEKIDDLEQRIKDKNKRIDFLMDVINAKDKKIEEIQNIKSK